MALNYEEIQVHLKNYFFEELLLKIWNDHIDEG